MSERDDFEEWLTLGVANGWISDVVCEMHDGLPWTPEEMADWDEGLDPCIPAVRVYGLEHVL